MGSGETNDNLPPAVTGKAGWSAEDYLEFFDFVPGDHPARLGPARRPVLSGPCRYSLEPDFYY